MPLTQLVIEEDVSNHELNVTKVPGSNWTGRLAANAELSIAIPADTNIVTFSFEKNVWADSSTITLPVAGAAIAEDSPLLNVNGIKIDSETTLYFICRSDSDIQISFWGIA